MAHLSCAMYAHATHKQTQPVLLTLALQYAGEPKKNPHWFDTGPWQSS